MDRLHCCTFPLGDNCEHSHQENSCIKCLTCFSFFNRNVFPLLKNVNEEVSSNKKDEVATMVAAVPNISYAVTHYASHFLCANVQFSAIEKIMQSTRIDPPSFIWFQTTKKSFAD